jgi:hypothetical protein
MGSPRRRPARQSDFIEPPHRGLGHPTWAGPFLFHTAVWHRPAAGFDFAHVPIEEAESGARIAGQHFPLSPSPGHIVAGGRPEVTAAN